MAQSKNIRLYRDFILFITMSIVFTLDQISKYLVRVYLDLYQSWPRQGFIRLTHGVNSGTAFGLFQGHTLVLIIVSFLAIVFLYYFYQTYASNKKILRFGIGLQLGGAFGNLIDRLRFGHVVDFIDVGPWPIFNLADSSIVIGIAILLASIFKLRNNGVEAP